MGRAPPRLLRKPAARSTTVVESRQVTRDDGSVEGGLYPDFGEPIVAVTVVATCKDNDDVPISGSCRVENDTPDRFDSNIRSSLNIHWNVDDRKAEHRCKATLDSPDHQDPNMFQEKMFVTAQIVCQAY